MIQATIATVAVFGVLLVLAAATTGLAFIDRYADKQREH